MFPLSHTFLLGHLVRSVTWRFSSSSLERKTDSRCQLLLSFYKLALILYHSYWDEYSRCTLSSVVSLLGCAPDFTLLVTGG